MSSDPCASSRRAALRVLICGAALAHGLGASAFAAESADHYPDRPIKLVYPFSPGGGTSSSYYVLVQHLSKMLGQPVVMEYKPGADGAIGTAYAAQSAPDGYTLLMGNFGTFALLPWLTDTRYDPVKDFVGVSQLVSYSTVLVVPQKSPFESLEELIDAARKDPGRLNYGTSSSDPMVTMELLKQMTQTDIARIPYKGSGPAVTAILSGEVDMMFGGTSAVVPFIQRGQLRALAVAGERRSSILPDVRTVAEAGVPGFKAQAWNGVMAPAGTPMPIVRKLSEAIAEILKIPEVRKVVTVGGEETVGSTPEQFTEFIRGESQRWGKVINSIQPISAPR
jgi:tripartite-type tricarboxylate transporter receptor subunit TctC